MNDYRYQFLKYKRPSDRLTCPSCEHKRVFTPYIDTMTGELLPIKYGRCERVNSCGYSENPYKDDFGKASLSIINKQPLKPLPPKQVTVFVPDSIKEASRTKYGQNNFVNYLHTLFESGDVEEVVNRYQIGTSNHWQGATVFWFIDVEGYVRAGQIKHFDKAGHTIKDQQADGKKRSRTTWVHSILQKKPQQPDWLRAYLQQDSKVGCLFGEQRLSEEPTKIVALCEAPKTAIIASLYLRRYVWLAVGSLSYLTAERCKALAGRKVVLFPDLNGFDHWTQKAQELSENRWIVSDFLEKIATIEEKQCGLDLADYLVRFDYRLKFNQL